MYTDIIAMLYESKLNCRLKNMYYIGGNYTLGNFLIVKLYTDFKK